MSSNFSNGDASVPAGSCVRLRQLVGHAEAQTRWAFGAPCTAGSRDGMCSAKSTSALMSGSDRPVANICSRSYTTVSSRPLRRRAPRERVEKTSRIRRSGPRRVPRTEWTCFVNAGPTERASIEMHWNTGAPSVDTRPRLAAHTPPRAAVRACAGHREHVQTEALRRKLRSRATRVPARGERVLDTRQDRV